MRKLASTFLLLSFLLTLISLGYVANAQVAIGSRSEEVKIIQEILKADPEIYPEGYVTGYYGPLTQKAIKKLQKKCKLPETGVIDEKTEKCIYPVEFKTKVISPDGGEIWDRSHIQTITWEVTTIETTTPPLEGIRPYPFWQKASIDLFRKISEKSVFVRHIATVNLFDKIHSWKIASDIPNGEDYIIRISLGPGVGPIWYREKIKESLPSPEEIWPTPPKPTWTRWDESDAPFKITGEIKPLPNLEEVIAILERMIAELQRVIALLKGTSQ